MGGLAKSLVNDAQKSLVDNVNIDNVDVELVGSSAVFDFKGYPASLSIANSTLWSKDGHKGYLLQTKGRVKDLDGNQATYQEVTSITNSTLYKVAVDKQFNNLQGKGQKSLQFIMKNSIIAESTQAGNEVRGWLGGQNSNNPTAERFEQGQTETGWTDASKQGSDQTATSRNTDPEFSDAANGNFTVFAGSQQAKYKIGDPCWLVEYDKSQARPMELNLSLNGGGNINEALANGLADIDNLKSVSITLEDGNENSLETKGSGAQRLVFISLMQYIANNGDRNILWGIDEPEVFLQPKLQKKLNSVFNRISQKSQLIITTHSQHFINTERCENVMLMEAIQTEKTYVRKSGKKFYETDAHEKHFDSDTLKIVAIKNHLGIGDNDGWALMPSNILVEGECDKKYLEMYIEYYKLNAPNIFSADGASKLASKVNYLDIFSKDLPFTPIICCIFDDDDEGIKAFNALHDTYKNITIKRFFISQRSNGQKERSCPDYEIEDFLPPQLVFDGVNGILKDIKYRKISESDFLKRDKKAYKKKNILLFMEEIIRSKNSDKDDLPLSNPGYKKRLCEKCFSLFQEEPEKYLLSLSNLSFLKKLVNEANEKVES